EAAGHGRIVCVEHLLVEKGGLRPVPTLHLTNEWRTADGVKILETADTIRLHDLGGKAYLLEFTTLIEATVCPGTFGDTKEGSFGVRVRDELTVAKGKGRLVNAEGKVGEGEKNNAKRDGVWGLRSDWCDYSGQVEGKTVGVAVFADPKNPYPT